MDAETRDAATGGPTGPRVLEWFRTEARPSLHAAILPAILCATFGWLLLALAGRAITFRPPEVEAPRRPTLPAEAIVDAEGDPIAPRAIGATERALLVAGALFVLVSPLALVHRLQRRSRAQAIELLVRTDALVIREAGDETTVAWDELEEVRLRGGGDGPAKILLARREGSELALDARFVGITPEELVARIRAVRGRALFGLLEAPSWPERARDPER